MNLISLGHNGGMGMGHGHGLEAGAWAWGAGGIRGREHAV